jgi:alpha,alpha-trehalose phosphorylase
VLAAETGHLDLAYDYLTEAALMDLDDLEHDTRDGLHAASLAGTWIALVQGFAGLREHTGSVSFSPQLPNGITRLTVMICVQSRRLHVEIAPDATTYRLHDGEPLSVRHDGQPLTVTMAAPISAPNRPTPTREPPTQPRGRAPRRHR